MHAFVRIIILLVQFLQLRGLRILGPLKNIADQKKTLVLYAWHETPDELDNIKLFMKHGVMAKESNDIDFFFIDTTPGGADFLKYLPAAANGNLPSNMKIIRRENTGFDMCSWKTALNMFDQKQYDTFVLLNGSVRGPFLGKFPSASNFVEPFSQHLSDKVHLVGTSFNCNGAYDFGHVQSMVMVLDQKGAESVNATLDCSKITDKGDSIVNGEWHMSQDMLKRGYGLAALQLYWRGHDFLNVQETEKRCKAFRSVANPDYNDDPYFANNDVDPETLALRSIDPEEVVMFKVGWRNANPDRLNALTKSLMD